MAADEDGRGADLADVGGCGEELGFIDWASDCQREGAQGGWGKGEVLVLLEGGEEEERACSCCRRWWLVCCRCGVGTGTEGGSGNQYGILRIVCAAFGAEFVFEVGGQVAPVRGAVRVFDSGGPVVLSGWDYDVLSVGRNGIGDRTGLVDLEFGRGRAGASRRRAFWDDLKLSYGLAGGAGQCSKQR